jgi:DNA replication protein DnaC
MIKEFIPCRTCVGKSTHLGYIEKEEDGYVYLTECSCHREWRELKDIIYRGNLSNIWVDEDSLNYKPLVNYAGEQSKSEVLNLMKFVDNFRKKPYTSAILYLWGKNGTQKTTLAQWVGLSLIRDEVSVKFTNMQQLTKLLSDFNDDKDGVIDDLKETDLIIIDESFSKEKVTLYKSGFQLPFIEEFLKERIEWKKKSIIFISNVSVYDIASNGFSESIQSLIQRNTVTKGTVLEFKDEYYKNRDKIDIDMLFK